MQIYMFYKEVADPRIRADTFLSPSVKTLGIIPAHETNVLLNSEVNTEKFQSQSASHRM